MKTATASLAEQTEVRDITAPVVCVVTLHFQRPLKHFKRDGALKPGSPVWVLKTPDVDNYRHSMIIIKVMSAPKVCPGLFGASKDS